MEKFEKIMLPVTILLVLVVVWVFSTGVEKDEVPNLPRKLLSQSGEMGAVLVEVTPLSASNYEISFDTHSVELDFDPKEIVRLEDNKGNIHVPISWSGSSGGHHLSGEVLFPAVETDISSIKLTVSGIESQTLSFEWEL